MALVIEDGSVVESANSYVTLDEMKSYMTGRGISLEKTDVELEELLHQAIDYLASKESKYKGYRININQNLSFPRSGVVVFGFYISDNSIPETLKNAQIEAAIHAATKPLLSNSETENLQSKEGVGFKKSYFRNGADKTKRFEKIDAYLTPLIKAENNNRLVRV